MHSKPPRTPFQPHSREAIAYTRVRVLCRSVGKEEHGKRTEEMASTNARPSRKRGVDSDGASCPITSLYAGGCTACGAAWSCIACTQTRACSRCTPSARCGSCRNVHSKAHRAVGLQLTLGSAAKRKAGAAAAVKRGASSARATHLVSPSTQPSNGPCTMDFPRSRQGLNSYYTLLATTTGDLWSSGGGRWMHRPGSTVLHVERVVARDNYETPARIWRHAIATHKLDRDAHASSLNAVLGAYDTRDERKIIDDARETERYCVYCVTRLYRYFTVFRRLGLIRVRVVYNIIIN